MGRIKARNSYSSSHLVAKTFKSGSSSKDIKTLSVIISLESRSICINTMEPATYLKASP